MEATVLIAKLELLKTNVPKHQITLIKQYFNLRVNGSTPQANLLKVNIFVLYFSLKLFLKPQFFLPFSHYL